MSYRLLMENNLIVGNEKAADNQLLLICGAGGSRTLVQTRKPYAFYMLISAFGFRVQARPEPPTCTLASKISEEPRSKTPPIPDFAVPLYQTLRNKSF